MTADTGKDGYNRILYLDELDRMIGEILSREREGRRIDLELAFYFISKHFPIILTICLIFLIYNNFKTDPGDINTLLVEEFEKEHLLSILHFSVVIYEILLGIIIFLLERSSSKVDLSYVMGAPSPSYLENLRRVRIKKSVGSGEAIYRAFKESEDGGTYLNVGLSITLSGLIFVVYILFLSILIDKRSVFEGRLYLFIITAETLVLTLPILYSSTHTLRFPGRLIYKSLIINKENNIGVGLIERFLNLGYLAIASYLLCCIPHNKDLIPILSPLFIILLLQMLLFYPIHYTRLIKIFYNKKLRDYYERYLFHLSTRYPYPGRKEKRETSEETIDDKIIRDIIYTAYIVTATRMMFQISEDKDLEQFDNYVLFNLANITSLIHSKKMKGYSLILSAILLILTTNEYLIKLIDIEEGLARSHIKNIIIMLLNNLLEFISEEGEYTGLLSSTKFIISYFIPYIDSLGDLKEIINSINILKKELYGEYPRSSSNEEARITLDSRRL